MEMECLCVRVKAVKAFEQNKRIVCFWVDVSFAWCCCCCLRCCCMLFIDVARRYYAFLWLFYIFNATLSMVMRKPDIQSMFSLAQSHDSSYNHVMCEWFLVIFGVVRVLWKCAEPIHRSAKYSINSCTLLALSLALLSILIRWKYVWFYLFRFLSFVRTSECSFSNVHDSNKYFIRNRP